MTRRAHRSLLGGVGLLAAALVLLELLMFRLAAAGIGFRLAFFGALVSPAVGGVVALVVAPRGTSLEASRIARRAAHGATLGGAFVVVGAVGLTWTSQMVAASDGVGAPVHVAVGLASMLLGPTVLFTAMAVAMRALWSTIGQAGYAAGLGGALGCLVAPLVIDWVGAPRALVCVALVAAAAAFAFGRAGDAPRWSAIATLPLVVVSLVSGDYGEPWMKLRTDQGKRSQVDAEVWTEQGVVSVSAVTRSKARIGVDRWPPVEFVPKTDSPKKISFFVSDLPHELDDDKTPRGSVLVVAGGGGRQVATALAHGHPHVDVIEQDARPVNELLLDRYRELTKGLYTDERVRVWIGDVGSTLHKLPADYEHIIVLERMRFTQAAPRLLAEHDRFFSREAVSAYATHLRPGGSFVLEVPVEALMEATRVVVSVLNDPAHVDKQVLACSYKTRGFVLFVNEPQSAGSWQKLTKRCKRMSATVEYPFDEVRRGQRDYDRRVAERAEQVSRFETLAVIDDDRPFLQSASASPMEVLRRGYEGLAPSPEYAGKRAKKGEASAPEPPDAGAVDVATLALAVSVLLLLLAFFVPSAPALQAGEVKLSLASRLGFAPLGAALALGGFALTDVLVRTLGTTVGAWVLVVPLSLAAVGGGRLVADTVARRSLGRVGVIALLLGVGWLVVMFLATEPLLGWMDLGGFGRASLAAVLATVTGVVLGCPLALGVRLVPRAADAAWAWSSHFVGWGVGGALAATLVHHRGVRSLWLVSAVALALGLVLVLTPSRGRAASEA